MSLPQLIGMVHLGPLPGSPRFAGSFDKVISRAVADTLTLADAGFDAIMIENFGDAPFFPEQVPTITATAMTRVIADIGRAVPLPLGVNVLRNDGETAMAVAAATGAAMIRVNVLSGSMVTDQGPIVGRAAQVGRLRALLDPSIKILADVFVKHAVPPPGLTVELAAIDLWERGGADAIVVSGTGTGQPVDLDHLGAVHAAVPEAPLVIGSGATPSNVRRLLEEASAVIVGSSLKPDGKVSAAVDPRLAAEFVRAAR